MASVSPSELAQLGLGIYFIKAQTIMVLYCTAWTSDYSHPAVCDERLNIVGMFDS